MSKSPILVRSGGVAGVRAPDPATADGTTMPMLMGQFAGFDQWAEVDDAAGHYLERIAPGAFSRTIAEDRASIRVLYDHGQDPHIGRKPLAPLEILTQDQRGGWYGGRLFDAPFIWDILPALRAGLFGSSFRFRVDEQEVRSHPGKAAHNPRGLTERTLHEVRVLEVGPTPFPVYRGTSADARGTDKETISREEFVRRLTEPRPRGSDPAIQRWLDSIAPIPRGLRAG